MEIKTARLKLKAVKASDTEMIHRLHSFKEVDEFNTLGIPSSIADTELLVNEWIKKGLANPRQAYIFSVILEEVFIGLIGLNIGKYNYRIAETWYKLDPLYWKKGYATEALAGVLKFAFDELRLHRIEAGCEISNIASIKVLEKVGMVKEGCKRKILPIRGGWFDNYFYSILDIDYINNKYSILAPALGWSLFFI